MTTRTQRWFVWMVAAAGLASGTGCAAEDDAPHYVLCDEYCEDPSTFEYVDAVSIETTDREQAAQLCLARQWTCTIPGAVRNCDCDGDGMVGRRAP